MVLPVNGKNPAFGERCFVASNAAVIGETVMGDDCSVWFGASVRADAEPITIGSRTNIQDNVTIHNDFGHPVVIGNDVSIGHNAVVHGAHIGDGVLIGMGAVILNGAVIGEGSLVAAGAVVSGGMNIPPNSLVLGVPARIVKSLESGSNLDNAEIYVQRKNLYMSVNSI